ncbi:MAG: hypothetical protein ISS44_01665 [Candidatus Omnitrophica bacterium]|nr:hypothetical protein [Candidatus Omnitrophota bacterium]
MLKKKAVTLIEITVSLLILALIMAGMVNIFVATKRLTGHARYRMTGGEIGRRFLDPLQMNVRQDQWGSNCLSSGAGCPAAQTIDNITYTPTYSFSNLLSGRLRKVKLTLTWNEPS